MNTAVQERKFINSRVYPLIVLDGAGGRRQILPGEVVGGDYHKHVDMRKGLIPYNGPRNVGEMEKYHLPAQGRQSPKGEVQIPGIHTPRIEGAHPTESISAQAVQSNWQGKSASEWAKEHDKQGLVEYSKGTLLGLAQFLGINLNESASKSDVLTVVGTNLQSRLAAETINAKATQEAAPNTKKNKK